MPAKPRSRFGTAVAGEPGVRIERALVASVVGWAACMETAGPVGGSGVVEGTVLDLRSAVGGTVLARGVEEGAPARRGQVLMRLDCRRLEAQARQLRAQIAAGESEVEAQQARLQAARQRTEAGSLRARARRSEVDALGAQEEVAGRDAQRMESMGRYAPDSERDRIVSQATELKSRLQAARDQSRAAAQDVEASRAEATALDAMATAATRRTESIRAQLERVEVDLEECRIVAPRGARVEEVFFELGETAAPGAPLVRLVDLDDLWVTFYLANDDLAALTRGSRAEVRADAWPGQVFTGTVATVASEAEFTPRNIQTRDDRTRLVYPVEVRLANPGHRLRPGMPVEVALPEAR